MGHRRMIKKAAIEQMLGDYVYRIVGDELRRRKVGATADEFVTLAKHASFILRMERMKLGLPEPGQANPIRPSRSPASSQKLTRH